MKWRFRGHLWLWWPKFSEMINWNSHYDSWFTANSAKLINLKSWDNPFVFIYNVFTTYTRWHQFRYHYCYYTTGIKLTISTSYVKWNFYWWYSCVFELPCYHLAWLFHFFFYLIAYICLFSQMFWLTFSLWTLFWV